MLTAYNLICYKVQATTSREGGKGDSRKCREVQEGSVSLEITGKEMNHPKKDNININ